MAEVPILLLAAGCSDRMGQIKQLLPWGNGTLIEHQIQVLLKTDHPLLLVLGSHAERIIPRVESFPLEIVMNRKWETGMGSSVAAGVKHVLKNYPGAQGVLIALADQPLIPADHYVRMLRTFQPGHGSILASRSGSRLEGVPALFDAAYFRELAALHGEGGAKQLLRTHKRHVLHVECKQIDADIDTPDDYQRLHALYLEISGIIK